jgi:hypothetical protein
MWDLVGKLWNVPVYRLLGGATRDRIRVYNKNTPFLYYHDSLRVTISKREELPLSRLASPCYSLCDAIGVVRVVGRDLVVPPDDIIAIA